MSKPDLLLLTTPWCGACHTQKPAIQRAANKLGLTLREVNVERCPVNLEDICSKVEWVPTIMYQGKEISIEQLQNMANKR